MSWRDLKIWMKLMVVFGACLIIYVGTTIWNTRVLQIINAEKGKFHADQMVMGKTMAGINESYHVFSLAVVNYQYNRQVEAFSGALTRFEGSLKAIVKNATYGNEALKQDLIVQLEAIGKRAALMKAGQLQQGLDDIARLVQNTHGNAVKLLEQEQQRIENVIHRQKTNIIYVQLTTLLVFLALFLVLIFSIQRANKDTLNFSRRLSEGELNIDFGQVHKDEFGQINQTLFELQARMRVIVEHIQETLAGVKKASSEFFSSSQLISDGANNQAATSNEISSTIDQIAIIAQQSTENALQTSIIAKKAFTGIQKGAHDVNDTFHTIEEIAGKNNIISEISYQTKILSINASVEAARASEFGKGFGVIADQVKNLAEDSQKSATEIESVSRRGVNLTRELAAQLTLLVEEFQKTSDLINGVAESGKEQYEAIQQVAMAVQDLNNITQQNASSSEELAASSEQLVNLSGELEKTLEFFRLDDISQINNDVHVKDTEREEQIGEESFELNDDSDEKIPKGSGLFFLRNRDEEQNDTEVDDVDNGFDTEKRYNQINLWDNEPEIEEDQDERKGWFIRLFGFGKQQKTSFEEEYNEQTDDSSDEGDEKSGFNHVREMKSWSKNQEDSEPDEKANENKSSGVRINLTDNDELDNQFKKMK
jgi:methyl-accepting chemotaxis protein